MKLRIIKLMSFAVIVSLAVVSLAAFSSAWAIVEGDQSLPSEAEIENALSSGLILREDSDTQSVDNSLPALASRSLSRYSITQYAGNTLYDTAAEQAKAAYSSCDAAIIVGSGIAWVDALSAAGLAGALDCPILFTEQGGLTSATGDALRSLGVSRVFVIGGASVVAERVLDDIRDMGVQVEERLWGNDCYQTQMAIYEYGQQNGLWASGVAFVATGEGFEDATSISPVAFALKAPIFLSRAGGLDSAQREAIENGALKGSISELAIVGGSSVVSELTGEYLHGFMDGVGASYQRIWGNTQFDTCIEVARWAVRDKGFTWDNVAFATSREPYDALAGSVLQGKSKSVLMLAGDSSSRTISEASSNKGQISVVRFFGGKNAIGPVIRITILNSCSDEVVFLNAGLSLEKMAQLEGVEPSAIDPNEIRRTVNGDLQFAILNYGYSGKVSAAQIDFFIESNCAYSENLYGVSSKLRGIGEAVISAAKQYDVNEVYLISHAILESAWGCSNLAQGRVQGYEGFYNFFGIGAYDSDPNNGGAYLAKSLGWDSPAKAIAGAAQWISENYLNNRYGQDTLYEMRWNYAQALSEGAVWHQYATSRTWASGIANVMGSFYSQVGLDAGGVGLRYVVPVYEKS